MFRGMYRKQKVLSMSDNALKAFGNWLVRTLESIPPTQNEDEIVVQVKHYIATIIGEASRINERLLRLVNISDMEYQVRLLCLKILLNEGVKRFEDCIEDKKAEKKFWEIFAEQSSGLQMLDLQNTMLRADRLDILTEILRKSPDLTHLELPYMCTSEMLTVVGQHCTKLCFLKMTEYGDVNNAVEFLCNSRFASTLTKIELEVLEEYCDAHVIANVMKLLLHCPNVEIIKKYSFVSIALKICQEKDENFKCNLKSIRDRNSTEEKIRIIAETCPKLEELDIVGPHLNAIRVLNCATLQKLSIKSFSGPDLIFLLESMGQQLRVLSIIRGNTTLDVVDIARCCPNLTSLTFDDMKLQFGRENFSFHCLEKLELCETSITDVNFKRLLRSTHKLKVLIVDEINIDDQYLESIFSLQNFNMLEEFCMKKAPNLTIATAHMLLWKCPKLQKIGKFYKWNVTQEEIDAITYLEKCGKHDFVLKSSTPLPQSAALIAVTLQDYLRITNNFVPFFYMF